MSVKRVLFRLRLTCYFTITGAMDADPLNGVHFKVFANTSTEMATASMYDPGWNLTRDVRYPASPNPAGTSLLNLTSDTMQHRHMVYSPIYKQWSVDYDGGLINYVWEGGVEDNISIHASLENVNGRVTPDVSSLTGSVVARCEGIQVHYATQGHDTPVETHTPVVGDDGWFTYFS